MGTTYSSSSTGVVEAGQRVEKRKLKLGINRIASWSAHIL